MRDATIEEDRKLCKEMPGRGLRVWLGLARQLTHSKRTEVLHFEERRSMRDSKTSSSAA